MLSPGRHAALKAYGLEKTAGIGSWLRGNLIGAPGAVSAVRQQAQAGGLMKPGGAYHGALDWLKPKLDFGKATDPLHKRFSATMGSMAHNVMGPGMMALQGYQALTAPPDQKGEAVGRLVGGLAGGTLGTPFGLAGQMAGGMAGDMAGSAIGKHFGNSPQQTSPFDPAQQ